MFLFARELNLLFASQSQRLQELLCAKLIFWHCGQAQFPSTPAIGGPRWVTREVTNGWVMPSPTSKAKGFRALQRLHSSRLAKFTFPQARQVQLPSTPATGPLVWGADGAVASMVGAVAISISGGLGVLQRLQRSRCGKFTLPQASQAQLPSKPAIGGPRFCNFCSLGIAHKLQASRCAKFTLPQDKHSQFPLMPAIGLPPVGWTYGLGVAQRLQVSRNGKFTLPHASQDQFPSKPATGGLRFDGSGVDSKLGFGKAQPVKSGCFFMQHANISSNNTPKNK